MNGRLDGFPQPVWTLCKRDKPLPLSGIKPNSIIVRLVAQILHWAIQKLFTKLGYLALRVARMASQEIRLVLCEKCLNINVVCVVCPFQLNMSPILGIYLHSWVSGGALETYCAPTDTLKTPCLCSSTQDVRGSPCPPGLVHCFRATVGYSAVDRFPLLGVLEKS